MKRERQQQQVETSNTTVVFEGSVTERELNKLFKDYEGDIVINGMLTIFENPLSIKCNSLYASKIITMSRWLNAKIEGDVYIDGDIDCYRVDINGSLNCKGNVNSLDITVAENFCCEGSIDANYSDIFVGKEFYCMTSIEDARSIRVLEDLLIEGTINNVYKIHVG